ncbi:MAG: ATP-binding protein [Desertimonas sp.]
MPTSGAALSVRRSPRQEAALAFEMPARPESVALARRRVRCFLVERAVPAHVVVDVELVTSELVTNALRHGGLGEVDVEVRVRERVDVTLRVVSDGSSMAIPPVATWATPTELTASGHGLAIVRRLSDDVGVDGDDRRAAVTSRVQWSGEEDTR